MTGRSKLRSATTSSVTSIVGISHFLIYKATCKFLHKDLCGDALAISYRQILVVDLSWVWKEEGRVQDTNPSFLHFLSLYCKCIPYMRGHVHVISVHTTHFSCASYISLESLNEASVDLGIVSFNHIPRWRGIGGCLNRKCFLSMYPIAVTLEKRTAVSWNWVYTWKITSPWYWSKENPVTLHKFEKEDGNPYLKLLR